jgi:hypothetical protein
MPPIRAMRLRCDRGCMPTDRPHPGPSSVPSPPAWQPPTPAPWPVSASSPGPALASIRTGGRSDGRSSGLGAALIVGLVAAAAGFVELSFWSTRTENGLVVECSYTNVAPWIFGPVAVVCGLIALLGGRRGGGRRRPLVALVLAAGLVHVATALAGLDLLGRSPC